LIFSVDLALYLKVKYLPQNKVTIRGGGFGQRALRRNRWYGIPLGSTLSNLVLAQGSCT
jgi:hypothetical protein